MPAFAWRAHYLAAVDSSFLLFVFLAGVLLIHVNRSEGIGGKKQKLIGMSSLWVWHCGCHLRICHNHNQDYRSSQRGAWSTMWRGLPQEPNPVKPQTEGGWEGQDTVSNLWVLGAASSSLAKDGGGQKRASRAADSSDRVEQCFTCIFCQCGIGQK